MTNRPPIVDRLTRVTPLGLRFWDAATGVPVGEGLVVTAYPSTAPWRRIPATTTRSANYVLHGLPGLRAAENGAGDEGFWTDPPAVRDFMIEVVDLLRRFHPCTFVVTAPHRGLFSLRCGPAGSPPPVLPSFGFGSPPDPPTGVPLFSAPGRPAPPGMAVLRAELMDAEGSPAAWALIEATPAGQAPRYGVADALGRVALIFPYPEPDDLATALPPDSPPSSPVSARKALPNQTWTVDLRAFFAPTAARAEIPDICQILNQVTTGPLTLLAELSPATPLTSVTLEFGRELAVTTRSRSALIFAAGSPP